MGLPKTRTTFFDTAEGQAVKLQLQQMADSNLYNTSPSYNTDSVLYPNNRIAFVDKHMNYLIKHPSLEANKYLANIKLMTKVRKNRAI